MPPASQDHAWSEGSQPLAGMREPDQGAAEPECPLAPAALGVWAHRAAWREAEGMGVSPGWLCLHAAHGKPPHSAQRPVPTAGQPRCRSICACAGTFPGSTPPRAHDVHRGQFTACAVLRGCRATKWVFSLLVQGGTVRGGMWQSLTRGQGARATQAPCVLVPIPPLK